MACSLPTCSAFRGMKRAELLQLASEYEVEVSEGTTRADLASQLYDTLEFESVWEDQDREREREREDQENQKERDTKIALAKLDVEKAKATRPSAPERGPTLNIAECKALMSKFNEDAIEAFFDVFERIAEKRDWPERYWPTIVQNELTGWAQSAVAALGPLGIYDFEDMRKAMLVAYGNVPESYRKKFRSLRRESGQTYLELSRQKEIFFDR